MEIVKKLMLHVDKAEGTTYRDELLTKIIDICSQSNYQYITNFEWSEKFCTLALMLKKIERKSDTFFSEVQLGFIIVIVFN